MSNSRSAAVAAGILPELAASSSAGICFFTPAAGRVNRIDNHASDFKEIVRSCILVEVGDIIKFPITDSTQRSGFIIYANDKPIIIDPGDVIKIITG